MDSFDELNREGSLEELEPSPIEDTPSSTRDSYFPPDKEAQLKPSSTSSTLGLESHSPVWYLTRIQRYSSYAFSIFTAFHVANTALIPLVTRSVPASESYLLLTRPYYQSPIAEPLIIALPLIAHIGSGIGLRLYRRNQNLKRYGAESRNDRRMIAWPKLSGTSALGYSLIPLLAGHAFVNRIIPLWYDGGSSNINLSYVSHGFAKHPAVSFFGFGALVVVGVWHSVWGWAKWLNLSPTQVTQGGVEGQMKRKRRWYLVNAVSAALTAIWLAGGVGIIGRGGEVGGWIGKEYDELYRHIPLFDPFSKEVWRNIPSSGRFLLSESSVGIAPDPLPFARGASFIPISTKSLYSSPSASLKLLKQSLQLIKTYPELLSSSSYGSINRIDIADANGHLQRANDQRKVDIVRYGYGTSLVKVLPRTTQLRFSSEANYLLVGCLGGLGRSLTRWMIEREARHFAFISRSGADKPEVSHLIESIQRSGASTQVFRADASDEGAVRRIVLELNADRPIRGAVHAAMVLKDGMFEKMDHQSFADCIIPKAVGALSLNNALEGLDLDFFVMTSSISALLGNTGQSNYSAANSVLEALAHHRSVNGLAVASLVLPMVLDVGVVAENEMFQGFEVAMSRPLGYGPENLVESQVIMGMEARELGRSMSSVENVDAYWYNDARFSHVRGIISGSEGHSSRNDSDSFAATIKEAQANGVTEVLNVISKHIVKRMSSILMIPVDDFELDGPSLGSYGLDSMIGVEMRTWLFKEFGLDYPFQKLLAPTLTFKGLAGAVAEKMGLTSAK